MSYGFLFIHPSFKTRTIVENKCVPRYKYRSHFNSREPGGNDLLICGNPTRPASLVTTTTAKPTLSSPALLNSEKTPVVIAANLFATSLWERLGMRHQALGSHG